MAGGLAVGIMGAGTGSGCGAGGFVDTSAGSGIGGFVAGCCVLAHATGARAAAERVSTKGARGVFIARDANNDARALASRQRAGDASSR